MTQPKTITEAIASQLTKTEYERQMDAIRLFPDALRVAESLGRDKAECIQSANRAIAVITGVNVLELFKAKAPAPVTEEKYLTLGQLGHRLNTNWQTATKRLQAIDLYEQIVEISTPQELMDAMRETVRRMRRGDVYQQGANA